MSNYQYVPARTNHILHFVISCFTLGLWLPVWFLVWLANHNRSVTKRLPVAPQNPAWMHPQPPQYPPGSYPPAPYREGDNGWGR